MNKAAPVLKVNYTGNTNIIYPSTPHPAVFRSGIDSEIPLIIENARKDFEVTALYNDKRISCRIEPASPDDDSIWINTGDSLKTSVNPSFYWIKFSENDIPTGTYDLEIKQSDGNLPFYQKRSIIILPKNQEEFEFCVITDLHLGDHKVKLHGLHFSNRELVAKHFRNIMKNPPLFVVILGDLVSSIFTFSRDYPRIHALLEKECRIPYFILPGNHDGYALGWGNHVYLDGWDFWKKYFKSTWFSFDIGPIHFIGLNSYDWPYADRNLFKWRYIRKYQFNQAGAISNEQLEWLKKDLKQAYDKNSTIILFSHHNPLHKDFIRANGKKIPGGWSGPGREKVMDLINEYNIKWVFAGHQHYNKVETYNNTKFITTTSAASCHEKYHKWGYRRICVNGTEINIEEEAIKSEA